MYMELAGARTRASFAVGGWLGGEVRALRDSAASVVSEGTATAGGRWSSDWGQRRRHFMGHRVHTLQQIGEDPE